MFWKYDVNCDVRIFLKILFIYGKIVIGWNKVLLILLFEFLGIGVICFFFYVVGYMDWLMVVLKIV